MGKTFDREREWKAVVEHVESKVQQVAEGHGNLLRELQATRADLSGRLDFLEDATMKGIGKVWQAINGVNGRLDQLLARLDSHERTHTS